MAPTRREESISDRAEQSTDMQNQADIVRLKLPTVLDLAAAERFLDTMCRQMPTEGRMHMDASEVETLTLPCIQILLAAVQGGQVSIQNPSPAVISAFEDLGLDCSIFDCSAPGQDAAAPERPPAGPRSLDDDFGQAPERAEQQDMAKRILTIDDSKTIRDMLMLTLVDAGFDVLQAVDGKDGLNVLDREQVDVVITDINMPIMDGYEVIRHMRSNSAHKTTPILVLTTESEADKKNLARAAGATGWMVKPFDPDRLIATINKVAP
jgi:two-component system, chemotaxis family, chemotaxis protein CheY